MKQSDTQSTKNSMINKTNHTNYTNYIETKMKTKHHMQHKRPTHRSTTRWLSLSTAKTKRVKKVG